MYVVALAKSESKTAEWVTKGLHNKVEKLLNEKNIAILRYSLNSYNRSKLHISVFTMLEIF